MPPGSTSGVWIITRKAVLFSRGGRRGGGNEGKASRFGDRAAADFQDRDVVLVAPSLRCFSNLIGGLCGKRGHALKTEKLALRIAGLHHAIGDKRDRRVSFDFRFAVAGIRADGKRSPVFKLQLKSVNIWSNVSRI